MEIYKELLKQKNSNKKISIENLTKEDFYFMYIEEGYMKEDIANLFHVTKNKVENLRRKWNIKVTQEFISDREFMNETYKKFGSGYQYDYSLPILKEHMGLPNFYDLFVPFLQILNNEKIHNIKEFWPYTDQNYEISEKELEYCISTKKPTLFYRADWCLDAMIRASLVEEIEIKEYKITKRGKELLKECSKNNIKQFGLGFLKSKYSDYLENIKISHPVKDELEISNYILQSKKAEEKIEEQVLNLKQIEYEQKEEKKEISKKKTTKTRTVKLDFNKINEAKTDFGKKCEEIVYLYEKQKLIKEGNEKKAKEVLWVSEELGDGAGYDIESFENINGKYEKIYIEVKGTDKNYTEPFEVTINEIMISEKLKENYYIYRIAKANTKNPVFYKIKGSISENFELEAIKFKAIRRKK